MDPTESVRTEVGYTRPVWIDKAPEQFRLKFEKHHKWVEDIEGGERANLDGANLTMANFTLIKRRPANETRFIY